MENYKPLYVWIVALFRTSNQDPLPAARALSIFFGLFAMAGAYFTAFRLAGIKAAIFAGAFWVLAPFTLFHDRLAIYDPLVAALSAWALYFSASFADRHQTRSALLFGVMTGLGLISKDLVYFFFGYPMAFAAASLLRKDFLRLRAYWKIAVFGYGVAVAILIAVVAFPYMKYNLGFVQSSKFFMSKSELAQLPFSKWLENLYIISKAYSHYLGATLLVSAAAAFAFSLIKRKWALLAVSLCWVGPSVVFVFVSKLFYSRYLLFTLPALFVAAALLVDRAGEWFSTRSKASYSIFALLLVGLLVAPALPLFGKIATDPIHSNLTEKDRWQYVEGWPSGYGADQIVRAIDREARKGPLTLFTSPKGGIMKNVLYIYLSEHENVDIRPISWSIDKPLLYFMNEPGPITVREERFLMGWSMRKLDPKTVHRALYVLNSPRVTTKTFVSLNPEAKVLAGVVKPGKGSLIALLEVPLPAP